MSALAVRHARWATAALRLAGIGWYIAITIGLGVFLGNWLDTKVSVGEGIPFSDHVFLIIGLFLGVAAAFWGSMRMVGAFFEVEKEDRD